MSTSVYRAIVSYSSTETGEIKVRIPSRFGPETAIDISRIGRKAYNGTWSVPQIGEQIAVTADDDSFTNVFWVQTNPTDPVSLASIEEDITNLQLVTADLTQAYVSANTDIAELQQAVAELESYKDAILLGIFG